MTVHRIKGEVSFSCDKCPETIETGETGFQSAWGKAREEGWQVRKDDTGWTHFCPGCS